MLSKFLIGTVALMMTTPTLQACDTPGAAETGTGGQESTSAEPEPEPEPPAPAPDDNIEGAWQKPQGSNDVLKDDAPPAAFGKYCDATCTVLNVGDGTCPPTVSGHGETTFLGGCHKACRRAREDASSKLPAGCVINTCNQTCS